MAKAKISNAEPQSRKVFLFLRTRNARKKRRPSFILCLPCSCLFLPQISEISQMPITSASEPIRTICAICGRLNKIFWFDFFIIYFLKNISGRKPGFLLVEDCVDCNLHNLMSLSEKFFCHFSNGVAPPPPKTDTRILA